MKKGISTDFSLHQQQILDFVAEHQLQDDSAITGRRIRSKLGELGTDYVTELLRSVVPTWLTCKSVETGDIYRVTLKGLLASSQSKLVTKYLEEIQRFLKKRFSEDPDFQRYTFGELVSFSPTLAEVPFDTINAIISISGWRNGGGSLGDSEYWYGTPLDIELIVRSEGLVDYLKTREGLEKIYESKDTDPGVDLILKIINLAEYKLRKAIRDQPKKEIEVQDAFETLLISTDIPYSRETDSIEYSTKTYTPDFSIELADLAIEIKLCNRTSREKTIIGEINDDILAYKTKYGNIIFIIYDLGLIRDIERFTKNFEDQDEVVVRIIKQ